VAGELKSVDTLQIPENARDFSLSTPIPQNASLLLGLETLVDPKADAWTRLVQQHPESGWSTDYSPTIDYVELRKRSIGQTLCGTAEYLVTVKDGRTSNPDQLNLSVSVERFFVAKAELKDHPNLPIWGNGFR
jgi:hypothetical protein